MKRGLLCFGAVMLVLALLLTLAPACGKGEEGPGPGVTPTPGVTPSPTPKLKEVKIGFLMPLSGPGGAWGVQFRQGYDWAINKINAAGGVKIGADTYIIKKVVGDDKLIGSEGAKEATRMVYQEHIHYVQNLSYSAPEPIWVEGKVFYQSSSPTLRIGPDKPYAIQTAVDNTIWYPTFWDQAYKYHPEIKTVAILYNDSPGSKSMADICKGAHEAHGTNVVAMAEYRQFSQDYYPVLTPVVAKNPDAIDFDGGTHGDIDLIVKQIRELGYKGLLFGPAYGDPTSAIQVAGKYAEGFATNDPDYSSELYPETTRQLYAEFKRLYPGQPMALTTYISYIGVEIFVQAWQAAGSIDPDDVMKVFDDPNFTFTAFGIPDQRLGGYETFGIRRNNPIDIAYSVVENGKKVMKSVVHAYVP